MQKKKQITIKLTDKINLTKLFFNLNLGKNKQPTIVFLV